VFVAAGALYAPEAFGIGKFGQLPPQGLVEMALGVAIGAITFTGSVIAFLKLSGRMSGKPIMLPSDVIVAARPAADTPQEIVAANKIPADQMGLDIGPDTAASFAASILQANTVFWNGPMGMFELAPFSGGTRTVAEALTHGEAFTFLGGGDTGAAIRALGLPERAFGYVSTGGGASLEFIQGKTLPGLAALERK